MVQTSFPLSSHTRYVAPRVEFLNQIFMVLIKPFCDLMSEHRDFWAQGSCGRNLSMEFAPKWDNSVEMENFSLGCLVSIVVQNTLNFQMMSTIDTVACATR